MNIVTDKLENGKKRLTKKDRDEQRRKAAELKKKEDEFKGKQKAFLNAYKKREEDIEKYHLRIKLELFTYAPLEVVEEVYEYIKDVDYPLISYCHEAMRPYVAKEMQRKTLGIFKKKFEFNEERFIKHYTFLLGGDKKVGETEEKAANEVKQWKEGYEKYKIDKN